MFSIKNSISIDRNIYDFLQTSCILMVLLGIINIILCFKVKDEHKVAKTICSIIFMILGFLGWGLRSGAISDFGNSVGYSESKVIFIIKLCTIMAQISLFINLIIKNNQKDN